MCRLYLRPVALTFSLEFEEEFEDKKLELVEILDKGKLDLETEKGINLTS